MMDKLRMTRNEYHAHKQKCVSRIWDQNDSYSMVDYMQEDEKIEIVPLDFFAYPQIKEDTAKYINVLILILFLLIFQNFRQSGKIQQNISMLFLIRKTRTKTEIICCVDLLVIVWKSGIEIKRNYIVIMHRMDFITLDSALMTKKC